MDATPPILIYPNPSLKTRARPVTPSDRAEVAALLPGMFRAMYEAPGIGLAAPQIGVNLRLCIVDLMPDEKSAPLTLINPKIIAASETLATREEGCLSLPNIYADVTRPAEIRLRYEDEAGATHQLDAQGLLATCLQHEIDHLDGILFTDHLSMLKRNVLLRRLAKELRQQKP